MRALAALGRVGSFVLVESPGKIDFLFAECFGYEGVLCGIASSTLVLRDLWCLPRVLMARSKNPMIVQFGFVIKEERKVAQGAPGTDRHSGCSSLCRNLS